MEQELEQDPLDFSQTERIVLLIDLHPLTLDLQNPKPKQNYISSVLSSARILLNFPVLSNSLFAFKLFFSSLSPILSSSKLHSLLGKSPSLLSFDRPLETLNYLSETLNSLSDLLQTTTPASSLRGTLMASTLRQLLHDYAWEPRYEDVIGTGRNFRFVRSNLVIMFCHVSRSVKCLGQFMSVEVGHDEELLINVDAFCERFVSIFGAISEGFVIRDMHLCWIDVSCELEFGEPKIEEEDQTMVGLGLLERGIKSLGWGYCSTDAVVLGSALVPFGLIYPKIGACLLDFSSFDCGQKVCGDLILKIQDVGGNPLECKCCDLEFFNLKLLSRQGVGGCLDHLKEFAENNGDQPMHIFVREVWGKNDFIKLNGNVCDFVLLQECLRKFGRDEKRDASDVLLSDRVLEMLQIGTAEFGRGRVVWQVFLTLLYRRDYVALVSISNEQGLSVMGILKPFTVHSAILCVLDSKFATLDSICKFYTLPSSELQTISEKDSKTSKANTELINLDGSPHAQQVALSYKLKDHNIAKKTKSSRSLKDFSWSSFREAVLCDFHVDLEDVYFAKASHSKKFRFLKCWMKQMKKSCRNFQVKANETKPQSDKEAAMKQRLTGSEQESELPVLPSFSNGDPSCSGSCDVNGEVATISCFETPEAFFSSIFQKMQKGLESGEVDLVALAERLISSSIFWLYRKYEMDNTLENSTPKEGAENNAGGWVALELSKFLLSDPKSLADKHKSSDMSSLAPDSCSAACASETKVREYELQILFRLEILQSEIGVSIKESAKQKMVKQICSLLESIQCLAGGFVGDFNLDKYVERTIKNRYSHSLADVIHKIYCRMDLLLFDDDDGEAPGSLRNSEDGDSSRREKIGENEIGGSVREVTTTTSKGISLQEKENVGESSQRPKQTKRERSLIEAQERRERARRFASFTSWVPDLQRVWAPKQQLPMREKSESSRRLAKRNRRRMPCDMVCETPRTAKRCFRTHDTEQTSYDMSSSCPVSKALFQDDAVI